MRNRKTKRALLLLSLALIVSLALSGCHGSKDTNSFAIPKSFDTSRNYEITFWAKKRYEQDTDGYLQKSDLGF